MKHISEVILVEGRYDKAKLEQLVDAFILPVGGFNIFRDSERSALIKKLASQRGAVILTDSDDAGQKIRVYLNDLLAECRVINLYIPDISGKERRKRAPSKEGTVGVEGVPAETLLSIFESVGGNVEGEAQSVSALDLYNDGLSGGIGSAEKRRLVQRVLGLPRRMSKNELLEAVNSLYGYERYKQAVDKVSKGVIE